MDGFVRFFEIPASNMKRAVEFYQTLFDVRLSLCECGDSDAGGESMALFPGEIGAIVLSKGFEPSGQGVLVSFAAYSDMDEMLGRVAELAGRVLRGRTRIEAEGKGFFALLMDSEGNRIGLHSAD